MKHGEINPIARHGKEPEEIRYSSLGEMVRIVSKKAVNDFKSTAIICKSERDVKQLGELLNVPFTILSGETKRFTPGILLTTIQYAKGLEFDVVIIPYVDATHYDTSFDGGLLYIATTRAMHELTVLVDAYAPSPLL